ncbi:Methyltransferase type 11 [Desulfovibrio sp. X2]|uniref:methyltransferase domain-containing protein n=1 Tax=Desulfovibrio sp. X2 TaxID=941449 RepID=UPI000358ED64|nr:methyltransferase domain-containing protein [Desulfovibrio sp. X2]EPR41693.1 Methyltransferase type 11 [Desulfovibrio sp. X2]
MTSPLFPRPADARARKMRVAASFSAAAVGYERAAEAQRRAAAGLCARIAALPLPAEPRVLEVGCGTGLLTRRILDALPGARVLATDISPGMLDAARAGISGPDVTWRLMDGERPDAAPASCDLIAASLAVQWFSDLSAGLAALARCLAPGGTLAVSLLGGESFREWRQACAGLGLSCGVPDYPDAETLAGLLPDGGTGRVEREVFAVEHADGLSFARSLKAIGAAVPREGHVPLAPGSLRKALCTLGAPCTATYDVLYAVWRKERHTRLEDGEE